MSAYELTGKRIWVAGHGGLVGSAIVRRLASESCEILTASREQIDLRRQADVEAWIDAHRPHAVFVAAALAGGILANDSSPADFIYDNLMIEANIVEGARRVGVEKLLFLGSSCVYPKHAPQPLTEASLLTGPLEPTNQWYAVAKIAGIKLCQAYRAQYGCDFISAMPTNLYGPGDNFDLHTSHVLPALLVKSHLAKVSGGNSVEVWGSGTPRREFMHVDDAADALVHLMTRYQEPDPVNIGAGKDITIRELAQLISDVVGFEGELLFDPSKPDGTPQKLMDTTKLAALGWVVRTPLREGIAQTYQWYLDHVA